MNQHYLYAVLVLFGISFVLKRLFKNALLPVPIARVFGRYNFFWWYYVLYVGYFLGLRVRPWKEIRPRVFLGKCPLPMHVRDFRALQITRVLNLQDEYSGPLDAYDSANIEQLHLPTIDHMEPSEEQIAEGVRFIERAQRDKTGVYIHCQGGHGRSAAIVFAWLCRTEEHKTPAKHNYEMSQSWSVRKSLHSQPSITKFLNKKAA